MNRIHNTHTQQTKRLQYNAHHVFFYSSVFSSSSNDIKLWNTMEYFTQILERKGRRGWGCWYWRMMTVVTQFTSKPSTRLNYTKETIFLSFPSHLCWIFPFIWAHLFFLSPTYFLSPFQGENDKNINTLIQTGNTKGNLEE